MSQYLLLNKTFGFINYILLYVILIGVTFGHNYSTQQTSKTLNASQNSDQNFSLLLDQNSYLTTNSVTKNYLNGYYKSDYMKSDAHKICNTSGDCDHFNEYCCPVTDSYKMCIYSPSYICKGKLNANCSTDYDCESILGLECIARKSQNPSVRPEEDRACLCPYGKSFDSDPKKALCVEDSYDPKTAMQIYKITMIFASCCLALILIIFLVCILRKSYCPPRQSAIVPLDNSTLPDIFTLFPHVGNYDGGPLGDGTLPPFEKPPTYDETLTLIRNEIGIPPPAYRRNPNSSSNSSNQSTPDMSSRVIISRPVLTAVNDNSTSSSYLTASSSSLTSIAGPSGECQGSGSGSRQGIDNPAFC